jgi:AAA+ ATPase superfamily predicted ATPase
MVLKIVDFTILRTISTKRAFMHFVGRKQELSRLKELLNKSTASLIVVRGRRRIGKSRLLEEFSKPYRFIRISGLPPTNQTTSNSQKKEFAFQLSQIFGIPEIHADDWSILFSILQMNIQSEKNKPTVVLLDEISWIGSKDPNFLGKLKNAWDIYFKNNENFLFVLCGSASYWIEKNILSSSGFLGRISQTLTLDELSVIDSTKFWQDFSGQISPFEKFKFLSVTGGIPKYLEEMDPKKSAEDNIKTICFSKGGLLVDEFHNIFSDLFLHNSEIYEKIVAALSTGIKDLNKICECINSSPNNKLSQYLSELECSGFIKREYIWHLSNGYDSKLSQFRLSDNYLRFYLKYMQKHYEKIQQNQFIFKSLTDLPEWYTILGLQFENLVLNNRTCIHEQLGINPYDIVCANPFFQKKNTKNLGCQIDYLIQTKYNILYLCEIKFSKRVIGLEVINKMKTKVESLRKPKGMSCRTVLIHVNGVTKDLRENLFFTKIIDFSELLK